MADEAIAIRDAACLVVIDHSGAAPRVLMGRRHADQVFLPNKWVFPGGRIDDDDHVLTADADWVFDPSDLASAIRPFALGAIRELLEETGFAVGVKDVWQCDGVAAWQPFAAQGYRPRPESLRPLARAITPPGRPKRYDTWFFIANRTSISETRLAADGELLDLAWFDLVAAGKLDLPSITRLVLEDVGNIVRLTDRAQSAVVPFYYSENGAFRRDLIAPSITPSLP